MAPTDITFATFNIRYGTANDGANRWELRREIVFETIREMDVDVLGLQEALDFQIDEILKEVPGYTLIGVGRNDGKRSGEFSPILYKADKLTATESGTFWLSDTPEKVGSKSWGNNIPRICTWAQMKTASGEQFKVMNTHFDHQSQPSRVKSAALIASKIGDNMRTVVMGDFNAGEENPAMTSFLGHGLLDTFRVLSANETVVGTFTGFNPENINGEKIDHVFCTKQWQVLEAEIVRKNFDGRTPSDHEPVMAKLRIR